MFMDIGVLRGGAVDQAGTHLGVEGLAQVGGSRPHTAAPAMDGPAVGGGAQEMPQQRQDLLLHHLRLARVELCDKFWQGKSEEMRELQADSPKNLQLQSLEIANLPDTFSMRSTLALPLKN